MSDKTGIAWTDSTWNPLRARHRETGAEGWACVRVSPGCQNCYAETLNENQRFRRGTGLGYTVPALSKVEHYLHEETLSDPLRWQKHRRIFVCSMTDLFGEWVTDEQIDLIFAVMALAQRHTFQVLTKRPDRMRAYLARPIGGTVRSDWVFTAMARILDKSRLPYPTWPLPNVWCGVTAEDQERADERIPLLLDTPAAVRFVSYEPALGPIDFHGRSRDQVEAGLCLVCGRVEVDHQDITGRRLFAHEYRTHGIDWLIVGGESGPRARPFDVAWARSVVAQGRAAGVPVFVKQMGARPFDVGLDQPEASRIWPVGTRWGHIADGVALPDRLAIKLAHSHGANPDEWPTDLRVQEFPAVLP